MNTEISVILLVLNGEKHLKSLLTRLSPFSEIILYDTGSFDQTLQIASCFKNVKIVQHPLYSFGEARNHAAQIAKNDWILSIDVDELPSQSLIKEIGSKKLNAKCIYSFSFQNFFRGKKIRFCGWNRETHIRLYNKKHTSFTNAALHEGVEKKNCQVISMKNRIDHFSYHDVSDF